MGFIAEFKKFVSRGKVMDLAIGVVIGGAFHKIISSLVSDIIMPPLGILMGDFDFTRYKIILKKAVMDAGGNVISEPITLNAGSFAQTVFDFMIIALTLFITIKAINRFAKEEEKTRKISHQEKLLTEIRDLLKEK